jgi:hypothetical protein
MKTIGKTRIIEAICLGLVTLIIGKIMFSFLLNRTNDYSEKKLENMINMDISFFLTGIALHLLLENCKFNSWYCNKCTISGLKKISSISKPIVY